MSQPQTLREPAGALGRRTALDPYLELIGERAAAASDSATSIAVESRVIALDYWEWSALARGLEQRDVESGDVESWPRRLAEGVAFQARYLTHLARLQDGAPPQPAELKAFRRELIVDVAVGIALQQELQRDVDNLVVLGRFDEAKKLTAFRHKIGQGIARLKEVIGDDGLAEAESRAATMVAPAEKIRVRDPLALEEPEETPTQFRWDREYADVVHLAAPPRPRSRIKLLAWALAASVAGWIVVAVATHRAAGPPPLPLAEFAHLAAIQQVDSRPPSLFVTIRDEAWRALDDAGRRSLIDEVGSIAGSRGYRGIQFRTSTGEAVARWLVKGGTRLVPPPERQAGART